MTKKLEKKNYKSYSKDKISDSTKSTKKIFQVLFTNVSADLAYFKSN